MHYEVTMQLFEAFKHNPVIVTLIVLMIAASLGVLLSLFGLFDRNLLILFDR